MLIGTWEKHALTEQPCLLLLTWPLSSSCNNYDGWTLPQQHCYHGWTTVLIIFFARCSTTLFAIGSTTLFTPVNNMDKVWHYLFTLHQSQIESSLAHQVEYLVAIFQSLLSKESASMTDKQWEVAIRSCNNMLSTKLVVFFQAPSQIIKKEKQNIVLPTELRDYPTHNLWYSILIL